MFSRKTVFVVGAGNSVEYGFKAGEGLKRMIAQRLLEHDPIIEAALSHVPGGNTNVSARVRDFARAVMTQTTIDQLLNLWRDDVSVALGKICIARSILEMEAGTPDLAITDKHLQYGVGIVAGTWMTELMATIFQDFERERLIRAFENLTFVCFNYDRVIEQIAYWYCRHATNNEDEAFAILEGLTVIHPYGDLGPLPWQDGSAVPFGAEGNTHIVGSAAKNIQTFTETANEKVGTAIKVAINQADQIIFSGFSYLRQNMELLWRENDIPPARIIMNMYDMPPPRKALARQAVVEALFRKPHLSADRIEPAELTAGDFIRHWGGTFYT